MKKPAKRTTGRKKLSKKSSGTKTPQFKRSSLDVFDVPIELLDGSPENPQEMDDATFDELVEGMRREGFDEPIHIVNQFDDSGEKTGRFWITSGHHRIKAAKVIGLKVAPSVIKADMDDAARKIALVRRNQLRGGMNSKKFTALFREVAPILGQETAKRLMGFTKEAAFKKLYEDVSKSLPKEHRKTLDDAKETVTSVDDLSSILNGIFKKEGSKVKKGYMVFSYGGKEHHYFQIDKKTSILLKRMEAEIASSNRSAAEFFAELFEKHTGGLSVETKKTRKVKSNAKVGKNKNKASSASVGEGQRTVH